VKARLQNTRKKHLSRSNFDDTASFDDNKYVGDGDYIIVLKEGLSIMSEKAVNSRVKSLCDQYHVENKETYSSTITGFTARNVTLQDAKKMQKEHDIALVERDSLLYIDPTRIDTQQKYTEKNNKNKDTNKNKNDNKNKNKDKDTADDSANEDRVVSFSQQITPWGVERIGSRNVENNPNYRNKRVYVVDSGIAYLPQELNIDTNLARNFISDKWDSWEDCNGHGTHIAGTIGAKDNDIGVVGIAAGITVVPIRTIDCDGVGKISTVITALNYIVEVANPGDVINISLGGRVSQTSMDIAIENASLKGIYFTIAAGNGGYDANLFTPARAEGDSIYTVCALNAENKLASFSNHGMPPIDVCAPGDEIESLSMYGGVEKMSGTSMASPHVAALLVLDQLNIYAEGFVNKLNHLSV